MDQNLFPNTLVSVFKNSNFTDYECASLTQRNTTRLSSLETLDTITVIFSAIPYRGGAPGQCTCFQLVPVVKPQVGSVAAGSGSFRTSVDRMAKY